MPRGIFTRSEEYKKKMRERMLGEKNPRYGFQSNFMRERNRKFGNPMKGKKHTEETKRRISIETSKALKGKKRSVEHQKNLTAALKGRKSWNTGLTKHTSKILRRVSEKNKSNIWKHQEEVIRLYSTDLLNLQQIADKYQCSNQLIYQLLKKNKVLMGISKRKKLLHQKGILKTWCKGMTKQTSESLKRTSLAMKNGGALKARMAAPTKCTKPELVMISYLQEYNLPFSYVGNGKKWFRGETQWFNPDFINENSKIIIEVFGDYWHRLKEKEIVDKERLITYSRYGYKTLVIWEHELKSPRNVINKIENALEDCNITV